MRRHDMQQPGEKNHGRDFNASNLDQPWENPPASQHRETEYDEYPDGGRGVYTREPFAGGRALVHQGRRSWDGFERDSRLTANLPANHSPSMNAEDDDSADVYEQASDSWIPDNENANTVDYDPGSWNAAQRTRMDDELSDERIRRWICERLSDVPALGDNDIYVEVRDHEVTLTGHVDTRSEKYLAEEVVESVGGIAGINNRLEVASADFPMQRSE